MSRPVPLRNNQQGLVSLVVTMIIMIVLSLIVVGFAQLARREQRIALDHQLSQQATYAAESGINDAKRAIYDTSGAPATTNPYSLTNGSGNKDTCGTTATGTVLSSSELSDTVSWTCLLIDQSVPDLLYSNIQTDKSTVVPINGVVQGTDTPKEIAKLVISWQTRDAPAPTSAVTSFSQLKPVSGWGGPSKTGILRVDVTDPFSHNPAPTPSYSRETLTQNLFTTFLYPGNASNPSVSYNPNGIAGGPEAQGELVKADCSGSGVPAMPYQCRTTIALGNNSSHYYLRLRSIYTASQVKIIALDSAGNRLDLRGAQVEIDSTGKAKDVLKRIKVRAKAPENTSDQTFPEYAVETASGICKLLSVTPVAGTSSDECPTKQPNAAPVISSTP